MSYLLDLLDLEHEAPPLPLEGERAALESLARCAATRELRLQALVELMALEIAAGDELGFERLRQELAATPLPPAITTLFHARLSWGLAVFGRPVAAARARRAAEAKRDAGEVRAWLLELDRQLDHAPR